MRRRSVSLLFISFLSAAAVNAEEQSMRPGLWEMTTTSDLLTLAQAIPPNQMDQLIKLARQNGIDLPQIENGAATSKVCITQKMANQKAPPDFYEKRSGCATQNVTRIGSSYKADLVCSGPQVSGKGKAEGTFTSVEKFMGRTEFNGVVQGTPINEHADTSGRWISANCGTVKPLQ